MILKDDTVLLRDFKREDIAKRIEWETEKTEWQLWDGPWEYEGLTEEQKKENLQKYIKALEEWAAICESLSDEMPRKSFQICTPEGEYVGWCGSYFINEDCCTDENGDRLAIGIDLPEESARGKGLATHALRLFMAYLHTLGFDELYTQTWSGNERMIGLAEKLGFTECCGIIKEITDVAKEGIKAEAAHGAGAAIRRADLPERTVIIRIVYNDLYYTRNGMLVYMETGRLRKMKQ